MKWRGEIIRWVPAQNGAELVGDYGDRMLCMSGYWRCLRVGNKSGGLFKGTGNSGKIIAGNQMS